VSIIEAHDADPTKGQRLFMYLAYQAVHAPSEVPAEYLVPYAALKEPRRTFAGMLSALDEGVANVTEALGRKGM
jgi:arylsulfatase A-like enzyme